MIQLKWGYQSRAPKPYCLVNFHHADSVKAKHLEVQPMDCPSQFCLFKSSHSPMQRGQQLEDIQLEI